MLDSPPAAPPAPLAMTTFVLLLADPPGFFDLGAFELLMLALAAGIFACLVLLLGRAKALDEPLDRLKALDEIPVGLRSVVESTSQIDLQRLEHLLIDLRDAQKRLREQLMQLAEMPREVVTVESNGPTERPKPPSVPLAERVTNRLLALGFERIQILSSAEDLEAIAGGDGEVLVEARRDGATCKGRVTIQKGAIAETSVRSNHDMFP